VFSFLKDTRGGTAWTARDLIETLKVAKRDAHKILSILELQGYVRPTTGQEWQTTPSGEVVSGSKPPRFSRESVKQALSTITDRVAAINRDRRAEFKISKAVAFGDFLSGRPQVQAADVGVKLARRNPKSPEIDSGKAQEQAFLRELRRKSTLLKIQPYEKWMDERSHRSLETS
jgi:hypothetical protein